MPDFNTHRRDPKRLTQNVLPIRANRVPPAQHVSSTHLPEDVMHPSFTPAYAHTQYGPWCVLLYGVSVVCLASAWLTREVLFPALLLAGVGLLIGGLAPCFQHLTVRDEPDRLAIRFGPAPLFRTSVRYRDLERVEVGQTVLLDGWGIHRSLRGGWVWNIWGWDCVVVTRRDQTVLRIGTDEAARLAEFLKGKIT